ncbi:hypothetical protein TRIP_B350091 [uncultured Desulfatiglans sp.]|nr:hypothetical protein TRIP_B350091 [uncultured Desulfatiglans sp.]
MPQGDDTFFGGGGQPGFMGSPEDFAKFQVFIHRMKMIWIAGREIPVSSSQTEFDDGAQDFVLKEKVFLFVDVCGRVLSPADIVALSWTDTPIPEGFKLECADPYKMHRQRLCYDGYDGSYTEDGVPLCEECLKKRKRNSFFITVFGGVAIALLGLGLLWIPRIF